MTRLLVYSRHRKSPWWRHVSSRLAFVSRTTLLGEFRGEDDFTTTGLYRHLGVAGIEEVALEQFGPEGCEDIRLRCRFLRLMPPDFAPTLIGAMWKTLDRVVEEVGPDVAMSFCVDHYGLDIFERILRRHGVPLVGLSGAPLAGQTLVTARGEHNHVRDPSAEEVEGALATITRPQFSAFLSGRRHYDMHRFLRRYAYYEARAALFAVIERLRRDPLNVHYWLRRPNLGFRVRLRDRRAMSYLHADWEPRMQGAPPERRIFVALGVYPESTIDYWVRDLDLRAYEDTVARVVTVFAEAGFIPVVKDHPNMFGFQRVELFERLSRIPGVVFVPYEVPSQRLLQATAATFTFAGTVGLQAALAGRCTIVTDPYYFVEGPFIRLTKPDEIEQLPGRVLNFVPPTDAEETNRKLVRQLLRTCLPGDLFESWKSFRDPNRPDPGRLIESMNAHLPGFLARSTRSA